MARQDAAIADSSAAPGNRQTRGRADAFGSAGFGKPLDRFGDGQSGGHQRQFGAADLACPWPSAPRVRQFKLSNDPQFAAKLHDIVGLYVIRPTTPSSCRWMRRAKFKPLIGPSRACR